MYVLKETNVVYPQFVGGYLHAMVSILIALMILTKYCH